MFLNPVDNPMPVQDNWLAETHWLSTGFKYLKLFLCFSHFIIQINYCVFLSTVCLAYTIVTILIYGGKVRDNWLEETLNIINSI